ncbi:asp-tRNAAsn/Glu-tRNAGln amidotransferase A subunit and related amidase [Gynuella sunshinyii YC6258]|uniref:Asp-tRNAAsn/Glu-tRNAGln amidotransferase A subunit and related amidase n=2 Tax=Gynuella sunshinyii TaxID=1445505 RepID=A0A0C5VSX8_9GAMM|nr:asp-tRNAAsn/Glu-tRNAGln amidotransferase A subunit and related amidase [Gynuella sunshinyii YC6258]
MMMKPDFLLYQPDYLLPGEGPLTGLTLGVKDLFHIQGLPTSAGNPDWLNSHDIPQQTSPVVEALMHAGARFIGKTLTDELAYSLNGVNGHYGTPVNPATPDRLPGGSSSGSATLTASGQIDIGLGTDTGGSIRIPASYNGLYGLRPSHGLISTADLVALAPRFDTVGWMCRDAQTLAAVGRCLLPSQRLQSEPQWLWPKRLWDGLDYAEAVQRCLPEAWNYSVIEGPDWPWLAECSTVFRTLQGREIWRQHGEWITRCQPRFSADIHERFVWASQLTEQQEQQAEQQLTKIRADMQHWLPEAGVMLWPTAPGLSPLLTLSAEDMAAYRIKVMGLTAPAGLCGWPQLHIPALTLANGGRYGFSLLARCGQDTTLLQLAQQFTDNQQH